MDCNAQVFRKCPKYEVVDSDLDLDSDNDYATLYEGYDIMHEDNWKPLPWRDAKHETMLKDNSFPSLGPETLPRSAQRYADISARTRPQLPGRGLFIWDKIRMAENFKPAIARRRPLDVLRENTRRPLEKELQLHELRLTASYKESPGSINKVEQKDGKVLSCSAAMGGHADLPDEIVDQYNHRGSLTLWQEGLQILSGHSAERGDMTKHYTVNDVQFDNCSTTFVSSGTDKKVRIWQQDHTGMYKEISQFLYKHVPHAMAFKPGCSILAVATRQVSLYQNINRVIPRPSALPMIPAGEAHVTGSIAWGTECSSNFLFASSEPEDNTVFTGYHRAFDAATAKEAIEFDASEAGDSIAISTAGGLMALTTRGPESRHILRLYDIRNVEASYVKMEQLESFPADVEGEVNSAIFSPDDVYLALGRNDNRIHVYDLRMLSRGALYDFEHFGPPRTPPGMCPYGVVKAEWVESNSRRLGLITGGNDACIRLWDPLHAPESLDNGVVLAEVQFDIGHFSLGDRFKGEHQLVVGDSAVFDCKENVQ
ncbi:WD40-repeat-containing domain protein [Crucibulum laeve]|uniref:WD40-repeat-containing domain protein n=1 Tax=Crucibulum laeve TaxID=68775 RepID=A0A5C3M4S9_9AGAR|nr:WD40-repeat-containing domain protein [Crucibulum laeve]